MISDRAWYLAAAGVLAFGLSHSLLNSRAEWVSQISDRTLARVDQVSLRATECTSRRQILLERDHVKMPAVQIRVAQVQARLACKRAAIAKRQAELMRLEAGKAQVLLSED
jgi:hypothetical protein